MKKSRQSTNIVDARDGKAAVEEDTKNKMLAKAMVSPRTLNPEPVAWNMEDNEADRINANLFNPGYNKNLKKKHPFKDPEPAKVSKSKKQKNYDDIPTFQFLKHDISSK